MSRRAITWTVVVALALVAAMAYGSTRKRLDAPDDNTVLADSMLTALDSDDYAAFSANFSSSLRTEMDQAAFEAWRAPLVESIGRYQEITDTKARKVPDGDPVRYLFTATFSGDDSVQFVIVFTQGTDRINRVELHPDK